MIEVFVYGTLKPGEINDWVYGQQAISSRQAIVWGQLYALAIGYPALTSGDQPIQGLILTFNEGNILAVLDQFEQHPPDRFQRCFPHLAVDEHQYTRLAVETFDLNHQPTGEAWAYTMTTEQVRRLGGIKILGGQWTHALQKGLFTEACLLDFEASQHS